MTSASRTCLWFQKDGLDAARHYTDLIPDSVLETDAAEGSAPKVVPFALGGVPYQILNGGPHLKLTPAASIVVTTPDQAETDRLWDALRSKGAMRGDAGGWSIAGVCPGRSCRGTCRGSWGRPIAKLPGGRRLP